MIRKERISAEIEGLGTPREPGFMDKIFHSEPERTEEDRIKLRKWQ